MGIYKVKFFGPLKLGEGKLENQNHALIFTREDVTDVVQTIEATWVQISPTRNTDPCVGDLVRHKGGIRNVCQIFEKKDPMQKKKLYMMQNNEALQVAYVEEVFT